MKKLDYNKQYNIAGFTLLEVLIAAVISGVVIMAAFSFYVTEHNNMISQHSISDMQQNLKASLSDITFEIRNAGAYIPDGILPIESSNSNPDSLTIRYAGRGGSLPVGQQTLKLQDQPINVQLNANMSQFSTGDAVYLWYSSQTQGEWFTISNIVDNPGTGWKEIYHQGQELKFDPQPGDELVKLREAIYYINAADTTQPLLMRALNGDSASVFAENIDDFQIFYYLSNLDTVDIVTANDTIFVVSVLFSARTNEVDFELADLQGDGRKHRTLSTEVLIRNNVF
ncbi:MAG: prepilin-type N-terminal cleavage/methylation domain-containing protein [Candidatus Zixiibacteriota bacterium]